jgi:hypothetical protein
MFLENFNNSENNIISVELAKVLTTIVVTLASKYLQCQELIIMPMLIIFENAWFFTRLWFLTSKKYYNKKCLFTLSDFIKFWVNSLITMNKDQWKNSEFSGLVNKD